MLHIVEARTAGQVEPGHRHNVPVYCFGQLRDPVLRGGPFCPLFQGPNNCPGRNHRFALWFDLGVHQRLLDGFPLRQELRRVQELQERLWGACQGLRHLRHPRGCIFHRLILCLALGWDKGGLLQLICAGEEPLVRCLRDLSSQDGPSFFLPLHEARQVLCHGGLCLSLGLCNRGTSVGGGVHGFDRRGKKDFRLQDRRSRGPLEPKWWPKWILIKSQDKRPPTVNALAHSLSLQHPRAGLARPRSGMQKTGSDTGSSFRVSGKPMPYLTLQPSYPCRWRVRNFANHASPSKNGVESRQSTENKTTGSEVVNRKHTEPAKKGSRLAPMLQAIIHTGLKGTEIQLKSFLL